MQISERIKEIRLAQNMSQERFGRKIGVTGKSISAYECGRALPPLKILDAIAQEYGASIIRVDDDTKGSILLLLNGVKRSLLELESMLVEDR